uniref:hypothetical protein n=1 Tax=Anunuuluaehu liula TaxID=3049639 RepID=UPI00300288F8
MFQRIKKLFIKLSSIFGQVNLRKYSMFSANKFNIIGFREMLCGKSNNSRPKFVFFNFPNNPKGYTTSYQQMQSIVNVIVDYTTELKKTVVVIVDEAGYGFFMKTFVKNLYSHF